MPRSATRALCLVAPVALAGLLSLPAAADSHTPPPGAGTAPKPVSTPLTDFSKPLPGVKPFAPAPVEAGDATFSRGLPRARKLLGDKESDAGRKLEVGGLQDRMQSLLAQYEAEVNGEAATYTKPSAASTAAYLVGFPLAVGAAGAALVWRSRRQQTSSPALAVEVA